MNPHPQISPVLPKIAEAVCFGDGQWQAVVNGVLQKPLFNSKGPAIIFAQQVATGLRKAEPVT